MLDLYYESESDIISNHIEEWLYSDKMKMYIFCDGCKYENTCKNKCDGCINWKLYRPKEVINYEDRIKERNFKRCI